MENGRNEARSIEGQAQARSMVGIGGGPPTKKRDIRLGDVVVTEPKNSFGVVVQYDHEKLLE